MTSWFTKPMEKAPIVPRENPNARFAEIEQARLAYRAAERAWDEAKLAVLRYKASHPAADSVWMANDAALVHTNALKIEPPELTRLCGIERRAAHARNEALRAWLRAQGKLIF